MPPKKTGRGLKRKVDAPDSEGTESESFKKKKTTVKSVRSKGKYVKEKSSDSVGNELDKLARQRKLSTSSGESDSVNDEKIGSKENDADMPSSSTRNAVDVNANEKPSLPPRPFSHWLFKSEPETRLENGVDVKFGFDDLKNEPDRTACWDGVRNYQARNFMKDQMRVGDRAFFYHSNTKPPGIIGLVDVVKESYVDHTQFDRKDPHYDPKATKEKPRWFMVDVKYNRPLKRYITLYELKELHEKHKKSGGPLKNIALFTKARLSVQPLTEEEFEFILELENGLTYSD